jgi:Asp-tRNA(Asn)/Glu-tRNA(Gln) amidotransferase A subunit family amidase
MAALTELGVGEAADALRSGASTAEALAEALLARCAAASSLHAFISLEPDKVRAAARRADQQRRRGEPLGPLHGVPLAIKDNIDTVDYPTTAGTPGLAAHRPKRNAPVLQRLLDAGALVLGKANLQELAYGPTSNNAAFGPVRNPYDPTRIPGGSSGGTAAAVAARLAPGGLGTDTAGSVRVPGSLCGITTFRPSTLRWPQAGIVPISHTRDTAGPMTRSIADCVLLDGVVTGSATEVAPARLKGLRLGVPPGYFWENLDAEFGVLLEAALARLRDAGVVLVDGGVPNVHALDAAAGFPIALYEMVGDVERYLAEHATGLTFADLLAQVRSPAVNKALGGIVGVGAVSEATYRDALSTHRPAPQDTYRRYFKERGVAAIVFPTTPLPAAKIGADDTACAGVWHLYPQPLPRQHRGPARRDPARRPDQGRPPGRSGAGWAGSRDHQLLAIALALEMLLPRLPAPRLG